ncbi:microcephalin isoform X4 [Ahaetulla prasina]|uniref:microcephalin isoform X4 n=1 Tax=Ahaetulla prasina TaxID=499056 RepID=UPI0026492181|nr:microcephalin isoform X4 [Ahaetulla prasina]
MDLSNGRPVLAGVVAYVEVWSSSRTENYSKAFTQQLLDMGAKISKTLNKQVTHVIFKDGFLSTWNRAEKAGIKLVSVLWVEKCREVGMHIDESLYPAINTNEGLPQFIKKHKCMQPKDLIGKTPEKDRRLQKRMETMVKELEMRRVAAETEIPVLLFEDDGSLVYSPASKVKYQCSVMERRIKDMKEKRENVSPTASQLSQKSDTDPAVVSTTTTSALTSDNAKLSTSDAKNTACEPLGNHVNEPDRKLKITRIEKPLRTLVMTSMSPEMQKVTLQVLKKLGGFLTSDEVCKNTSHVIAGSPRRTLNILMGIARGCWIVCYDWVLWSLEHDYWISEEPFELSVDFPGAAISRFQHNILKEKVYQKLFANQPIMFISRTSQPPYQKLCELVQLCGGKVCKTLRQAKICIGQSKVGKYVDMQCLSEKWIIDSITHYRICPLENYLFQNTV